MRGAALEFFRRLAESPEFHGIIATNLMSSADFKALLGAQCPPMLVYFHENQLTYPLIRQKEGELVEKLADILLRPDTYEPARKAIAAAMRAFSWQHRIADFDTELETLAEPGPGTER